MRKGKERWERGEEEGGRAEASCFSEEWRNRAAPSLRERRLSGWLASGRLAGSVRLAAWLGWLTVEPERQPEVGSPCSICTDLKPPGRVGYRKLAPRMADATPERI